VQSLVKGLRCVDQPCRWWIGRLNKQTKKKDLSNYSNRFWCLHLCATAWSIAPNQLPSSMTEDMSLAAFDRHSLNFDNVALAGCQNQRHQDRPSPPSKSWPICPKGEMDPPPRRSSPARPGKLLLNRCWLNSRPVQMGSQP